MINANEAREITMTVVIDRFTAGRERAQEYYKFIDTLIKQNASDGLYSIILYPLRWLDSVYDETKRGFITEIRNTLTELKYKVTYTPDSGKLEIKWG